MLGEMSEKESQKYTFHGARRAHVTFAKNFGEASDGDVALGTKHAKGGTVPHYNDASRAQLSKPAEFQGQLRDKMKAVMDFKASLPSSNLEGSLMNTPPRPPGEVPRSKDAVSPTEVARVSGFLSSRNINDDVLRQVESIKPGASEEIMKIAAQLSLGKTVQQPRFEIMGKSNFDNLVAHAPLS